jgi:hypothetical protein
MAERGECWSYQKVKGIDIEEKTVHQEQREKHLKKFAKKNLHSIFGVKRE